MWRELQGLQCSTVTYFIDSEWMKGKIDAGRMRTRNVNSERKFGRNASKHFT